MFVTIARRRPRDKAISNKQPMPRNGSKTSKTHLPSFLSTIEVERTRGATLIAIPLNRARRQTDNFINQSGDVANALHANDLPDAPGKLVGS